MPVLIEGLMWYVAFLFSTVIHEASHAFAAMKLGDDTAFENGQVTLDPVPHIRQEPFGTVLVPLFSFLAGGWMIGWASAPYNPDWARRYPERSALMSLAGPASNLLIVISVGILIRLGISLDVFYIPASVNFTHMVAANQEGTYATLATFLSVLFSLNVLLFTFNLIPLPPLDGSGIIPFFLSREKALSYMDFLHNTPVSMLGIFIAWKLFDVVYDPLHLIFIKMLYPGEGFQ